MTTITEDYVSFKTAKLLKEKGFDEPCIWLYSKKGEKHYASDYHSPWPNSELAADEWSCCTQAVAMKWLREVYKIDIAIYPYGDYLSENYQFDVYENRGLMVSKDDGYMTYEQACEAAIKYCLEHLI